MRHYCDPDSVDELRADLRRARRFEHAHKIAARLAASDDEEDRDFATGLADWLANNGDLAKRLGLRGPRGRHRLKFHHRDDAQPKSSELPCAPDSTNDQQAIAK